MFDLLINVIQLVVINPEIDTLLHILDTISVIFDAIKLVRHYSLKQRKEKILCSVQ